MVIICEVEDTAEEENVWETVDDVWTNEEVDEGTSSKFLPIGFEIENRIQLIWIFIRFSSDGFVNLFLLCHKQTNHWKFFGLVSLSGIKEKKNNMLCCMVL